MDKVVYVCNGSCHAIITEEQYQQGLIKCGTQDCTQFEHPFEKRMQCERCKAVYLPGEQHQENHS